MRGLRTDNSAEKLRPFVGARIIHKGNVGTVRYIGSIDGHSDNEEWLGVEWDIASRGKHSGSHNNKQYFTTEIQNAGSFVKLIKVGHGGRTTLVQAAQQRLADAKDQSHRNEMTVVGRGIVAIADEGSAADQLAKTEVLDISNMGVAVIRSAEDEPLTQILPRLRDLSVARSLLSDVSDIIEVLCAFPKLKTLDASNNRLRATENTLKHKDSDGEQITENSDHESSELTELLLNKCILDWRAVVMVCKYIKALNILRVHACRLGTLEHIWSWAAFETRWSSLQVLDLDGNRITWNDVRKLSQLPSLSELYISDNGLEDVQGVNDKKAEEIFGTQSDSRWACRMNDLPRREKQARIPFPKLHTISIARNELRGWRIITALNALPELTHLRMMGNPISPRGADAQTGKGPHKGWHLRAIARVRRLTRIDGSDVTIDERLQAERRYVREEIVPIFQTEGLDAAKDIHPRADELMQKLKFLDSEYVTSNLQTSVIGATKKFAQEGLAADSVFVILEVDKRIPARRPTARRLLPRETNSERLVAFAKVLLRVQTDQTYGAEGNDRSYDAAKLSVTVRIGENGSEVKLVGGRSLASCVDKGEREQVTVTIRPM